MISGRIVIHKEPQRTKVQQGSQWNQYAGLTEEDGYFWMRDHYRRERSSKFSEEILSAIITTGAEEGFTIGARVRRTSGNPGIGTIIRIHTILKDALDEDTCDLTPYRVKWDVSPVFVGGEFNYSIDDLRIVSTPQLPILLEPRDETLSNISVTC